MRRMASASALAWSADSPLSVSSCCDVGDILLAQLHALRIGLQVVVAVRQAEAAGAELDDHQRRVHRILARAGAEEEAAGIVVVQSRDRGDELWRAS